MRIVNSRMFLRHAHYVHLISLIFVCGSFVVMFYFFGFLPSLNMMTFFFLK